jgi:hypothetical protein
VQHGVQGTDTAMASYMSELDWLAHPVTNHVLSAELHNQSVNSLALLSARRTQEAVTVLRQMLANILCAVTQAVDLRWLHMQASTHFLNSLPNIAHTYVSMPPRSWARSSILHDDIKWYELVLGKTIPEKNGYVHLAPLEHLRAVASDDVSLKSAVMSHMSDGKYETWYNSPTFQQSYCFTNSTLQYVT